MVRMEKVDDITHILSAVASFSNAAATLLLDAEGQLYPVLSKWSRTVPSILVTKSMQIARHASLYKNIIPLIISDDLPRDAMIKKAMELALEIGVMREGDLITVVEGDRVTQSGILQHGALQLLQVPYS